MTLTIMCSTCPRKLTGGRCAASLDEAVADLNSVLLSAKWEGRVSLSAATATIYLVCPTCQPADPMSRTGR